MAETKIKTPEYSWNRFKYSGAAPPPTRYAVSFLYDGKMYVFGGLGANKKVINTLSYLDLEKKEWSTVETKGEIPSPRCAHTGAVFEDSLYVFGGSPDSRYDSFDDFYVLNLKTNEWTQIAKPSSGVWPGPRYHHSANIIGREMFVFGGSKNQSKHYGDFFSFSFDSKTWREINAEGTPSVRAGHLAFVIDSQLYIFGGHFGDGGFERCVDMHIYTPSSSTWEDVDTSGSLPFTARALTGVLANNGYFYVYGGYDGKKPLRNLIEFHPKERVWITAKVWMDLDENSFASEEGGKRSGIGTSQGMEPTPRYGHVIVLKDEKITIFGGSGSTYLNDVFQFDLASDE